MVLDTSALVAIVFDEPEAVAFSEAIAGDPVRLISAASLLEAAIVIECRAGSPGARFSIDVSSALRRWWHPLHPNM
jgi:ribonuclease VapC